MQQPCAMFFRACAVYVQPPIFSDLKCTAFSASTTKPLSVTPVILIKWMYHCRKFHGNFKIHIHNIPVQPDMSSCSSCCLKIGTKLLMTSSSKPKQNDTFKLVR